MRLRATCEVWYAGKTRHPGDVFTVEDNDTQNGRILIGIGKAEEIKDEPAPVRPKKAAALPVEEPKQPESEPVEPMTTDALPKRRYARRDMQAENE
jgi:hypothetical protein